MTDTPRPVKPLTAAGLALLDKLAPHPKHDWDDRRIVAARNRRLALADDLRAVERAARVPVEGADGLDAETLARALIVIPDGKYAPRWADRVAAE